MHKRGVTQSGPGTEAAGEGGQPGPSCVTTASSSSSRAHWQLRWLLACPPPPPPTPHFSASACWHLFPKAASGDKGGPRSAFCAAPLGGQHPHRLWRKESCAGTGEGVLSLHRGSGEASKAFSGMSRRGALWPGFLFLGVVCIQRLFLRMEVPTRKPCGVGCREWGRGQGSCRDV